MAIRIVGVDLPQNKRPLRLTILHSGVRFFNDALTFISYFIYI